MYFHDTREIPRRAPPETDNLEWRQVGEDLWLLRTRRNWNEDSFQSGSSRWARRLGPPTSQWGAQDGWVAFRSMRDEQLPRPRDRSASRRRYREVSPTRDDYW